MSAKSDKIFLHKPTTNRYIPAFFLSYFGIVSVIIFYNREIKYKFTRLYTIHPTLIEVFYVDGVCDWSIIRRDITNDHQSLCGMDGSVPEQKSVRGFTKYTTPGIICSFSRLLPSVVVSHFVFFGL